MLRRLLWRALAVIALKLALLGIPLPGLPTVPFLLVSAWAAGKGWPELEVWLLNHPSYGPPIRNWREHGAISRKAKWIASVMMCFSAIVLWFSPAPLIMQWIVSAILVIVASWIWLRPEPTPLKKDYS